jgi:hypothetical protein
MLPELVDILAAVKTCLDAKETWKGTYPSKLSHVCRQHDHQSLRHVIRHNNVTPYLSLCPYVLTSTGEK